MSKQKSAKPSKSVLDVAAGSWMNLTKNLPNAMVIDLVFQEKDKALFAATYGRSIWRIKL